MFLSYYNDAFYLKALFFSPPFQLVPQSFPIISNHFKSFQIISNNFHPFLSNSKIFKQTLSIACL
ncbi:hypothetical protein EWZ66_06415 [Helicobacter pylori]|nr:hypothetical protein [Helicobacter pylori]NHA93210.1 hypothetical protein [Helicobacter pylori]NHA94038.1 hypothetical protein [Helicobacter pylori]